MHSVITSIRSGLLYSNVIVTVAAATMAFRTFRLAGLAVDPWVISLIAAATLAVYALHSLAPDERPDGSRARWNRKARGYHQLCLTVSLAAVIPLFLRIPGQLILILPAFLLTLYYMAASLLHFPVHGKTMLLAITWTYATMIMPLLLAGHVPASSLILPASILESSYIYLICLFFDHRDASVDMPRHWSLNTPRRIHVVMLMTAMAFLVAFFWAWMAGWPRSWLIIKAMLMFILIATSRYSLQTRSDVWYYGVLDGMMALDAICLLFMGEASILHL